MRTAMKKKILFDDWGPVPDVEESRWDGLRTAGEVVLIAACLMLGLLGLVVGGVLYLIILAALLCAWPFVGVYHLTCHMAREGATEAPGSAGGGPPGP